MRFRPARRVNRILSVFMLCIAPAALAAEHQAAKPAGNALESFSASVEALAARVSPSVVQIVVDRYAREASDEQNASEHKGENQSIGSGVIIDPSGYIVTNAHVVEEARGIRVRLTLPASGEEEGPAIGAALEESFTALKDAKLIGVFKEG